MKVPDMDIANIVKVLSNYPEQIFILNNIYISEVCEAIYSLENTYVDIASIEKQDVLKFLNNSFGLDRFLFASHSPFYFVEGNLFKLKYSGLDEDDANKVTFENGVAILKSY